MAEKLKAKCDIQIARTNRNAGRVPLVGMWMLLLVGMIAVFVLGKTLSNQQPRTVPIKDTSAVLPQKELPITEGKIFCRAGEWSPEIYFPGRSFNWPTGTEIIIRPSDGAEFKFVVPEGPFQLKTLRVARVKFPMDYTFTLSPTDERQHN